MRYAIISDIHSNFEALTAVLMDIEKKDADKICCLGDIVGYGPEPNECIQLVDATCDYIITGNHDFACIDKAEAENFNRFAKEAIFWTSEVLTESSYLLISQLELQKKINTFYLVHASPDIPSYWNYIVSIDQAIYNFSFFDEQICFIGHSHVPIIYVEKDSRSYLLHKEDRLLISENKRYLINVGSVGQPRDFNPEAAYGILDTEQNEYQLVRVPYDFRQTQSKMKKKGLPNFLINRLMYGR